MCMSTMNEQPQIWQALPLPKKAVGLLHALLVMHPVRTLVQSYNKCQLPSPISSFV